MKLQEDASVTESPNVIPESDSDESVDTEMCEKCGKEVSPFEMPEHLDFHYAQEMELREKEIFASDQAVKKRPAPLKDSSSEEEEEEDENDSGTKCLKPARNRFTSVCYIVISRFFNATFNIFVSGKWMNFIFKIRQIVAGIS